MLPRRTIATPPGFASPAEAETEPAAGGRSGAPVARLRLLSRPIALAIGLALPATCLGTEEVIDLDPDVFARPFPATRAIASRHGIAIGQFSPMIERDHLAAGDTVIILVTAKGVPEEKQWLIRLQADARETDPSRNESFDHLALHTNSGREIRFAHSPAVVAMQTWGPILDVPAGAEASRGEVARGTVNETFLRLGFADACRAMMQLHRARTAGRVAPDNMFSVGKQPFSGADLQRGVQLVEGAGFGLDDERAIAGTVPALLAYFDVAARTPGIRRLVWELLEKPSVWSVVRRVGRIDSGVTFHAKGVRPIESAPWAVPAPSRMFKLPFTLAVNDKPGLHCVLVVTQPRPPLLISAGIVGLAVHSPGATNERLFLRIVAARTAEALDRAD